jgi:hypothetical protein
MIDAGCNILVFVHLSCGIYSEELTKQNRDVREQKDSSGRR